MELFELVVLGSGPGSEPVWSSADRRSVAVGSGRWSARRADPTEQRAQVGPGGRQVGDHSVERRAHRADTGR
jgi:hypothetical protein